MVARPSAFRRSVLLAVATCTAASLVAAPLANAAEALLVVEADTGKVLHADQATIPWYPASITKILTAYVALRAVREGRLTLDSLFRVSATAAAAPPTKMGFAPGTTVTLDNALKMLMVKSANDVAITIAEGVSGSVENFAEQMNRHSKRLGMTQSHWVNPHGLPADEQITSARDMAMLARVVLREFPEYNYYWNLPGIRYGKRLMRNHNNLLGRYEGTDGMKTGFICASGFNVVATATRNGKRLIVVVLGSPSPGVRAVRAAQLFERGFQVRPLSWLTPGLGQLENLQPVNVDPPNLRDAICGPNRRRQPSEEAADEGLPETPADSPYAIFLSTLRGPSNTNTPLLTEVRLGEPVIVYTGPKRSPAEIATIEATTSKTKGMGKKSGTSKGMGMGESTTPALAHNPGNVTTDTGAEKKAGMGMAKKAKATAKKAQTSAQ
jgi:D-alanyl-D-alanine carboxypeptidase